MATILIVDDEPGVSEGFREALERQNHTLVRKIDAGSVLTAKTPAAQPDCVVLDMTSPGMDGLDALTQLRVRQETRDVPVILFAAASDDAATWAGWGAGANVVLAKPLDPAVLLDWIDRLLEGGTEREPTL